MKLANYVIEFLENKGIKKVFSVTGGGAMHLNDAFGHSDKIQVVYNHHEQACSMAAEGYTRTSGEVSCVCVTSGPGGTNTLTGVMGAWLDSIPMIIISGQMKYCTTIKSTEVNLRQLGFQEFNIIDAVKCMTKYAVMVDNSDDIRFCLEKAYYEATNGRPGPVWIDIPLDIQGEDINPEELNAFESGYSGESNINIEIIEKVSNAIAKAERPVVLVGNGVRLGKAEDEFLKFIEKIQVPVVHAWNAHGIITDDHPLYAGRPGTIGTRGGNFVIQNADLVISLGCRMHIRLISYEWQKFAANAYIIAVDIDENEMKKPTVKIDMPIVADVKDFLDAANSYESYHIDIEKHLKWIKWCKDINIKYPIVLESYKQKNAPLNPYVFMDALGKKLNKDDVIVASNGTACVCAFQTIQLQKGEKMFSNAGASSMGYGLPAAIGASFAIENRSRIICLEGDGSIQMNLQELQTVVHHGLNIKIFWLNNDGYHSIRLTQKGTFDADKRGYCGVNEDSGISFPAAKKIAAAYGIKYILADKMDSLEDVVNEAINEDGPVICEVILDPGQAFEPKLSSFVHEDGTITSPSLEDMYPFLDREEYEDNMISRHNV